LKKTNTIIACTLFILSINANAALVGNGLLTTDTLTGLAWLDLAETENMTFNQVYSETQAGGLYEQFHIATQTELADLFTSYAFNSNLWDFWGVTANSVITQTMYDDPAINEITDGIANTGFLDFTGVVALNQGTVSIDFSQPNFTTALVQTVPLPAPVFLLLSGLLGLFGLAKRSK